MTERIKKIREQSLKAINKISSERALLVTEFYKKESIDPIPVQRANCFNYILTNKHICINDGELIVGERGPAPKATPTYPEICLHSLEDLEFLNSRPKISFLVDDETRQVYKDILFHSGEGKQIVKSFLN